MYATRQTFGGQRASVGRVVVVVDHEVDVGGQRTGKSVIRAGTIDRIHAEADQPIIATWNGSVYGPDGVDLLFAATSNEDDVLRLPPGSWTWPPRI